MSDATRYFYKGGLNCAESTLRCLMDDKVIDVPDETIRMMSGFGGGMQLGSVCGAVVASVSAIGAAKGRMSAEETRQPCMKAVSRFLKAFQAEYGTIYCKELRATFAGNAPRHSEGMYRACTVFVEKAVELVKEVLAEEEPDNQA